MKKIIGLLGVFFSLFLLTNSSVTAARTFSNGEYKYTVSKKQAAITKYTGTSSKVTVPSKLGGYTVTSIGESAFEKNKYIEDIVLPSGVKSIENFAFDQCGQLKSITMPSTLDKIGTGAFTRCVKLSSIQIPDSVSKIGEWAFSECKNLESIRIPESVTRIEVSTFKQCSSLKEVQLSSKTAFIGDEAFLECEALAHIAIPDGVAEIPYQCFWKCKNLKTITLPEGLKKIEGSAFWDCEKVDLKMPSTLEYIGLGAFYNCRSLTEVTIPEAVAELEDLTFYNCSSVKRIDIPRGTRLHGLRSFDGCESLEVITLPDAENIYDQDEYITIPDADSKHREYGKLPDLKGCSSLKEIRNLSEDYFLIDENVIYSKDRETLIRYLPVKEDKEFIIPDEVTTIKDYAFSGAKSLMYVEIPDTVETIGIALFYKSSVENASFPDCITTIPAYTFYGCPMKEVEVPSNITKIGSQAYAECKNLEKFTINDTMKEISLINNETDDSAAPFGGCSSLKEFCVIGTKSNYKVIDGVLFEESEKNNLCLICYPAMKKGSVYRLPAKVTAMCSYAFDHAHNLRKIYLNDTMDGLYEPFRECKELAIYVPVQVENFVGDEHTLDWPIFTRCSDCYLYVRKGSKAYKYCERNKIPYRIWK